jgi:hypothetical protein
MSSTMMTAPKEQEKRRAHGAYPFGLKRQHAQRLAAELRELLDQSVEELPQLGLRQTGRGARREPAERHEEVAAPAVQLPVAEAHRHPELRAQELRAVRHAELRRKHTDDPARLAVDRDRAADDTGIAAEAVAPDVVREDDGERLVGPVVVGGEETAVERPDAERQE